MRNRPGVPAGGVVTGNVYDKYASRNPIAAWMVRNFLQTLQRLIEPLPVDSILEAGCGEGHLASRLASWKRCPVVGVDLDKAVFDPPLAAGELAPRLSVQSIDRLGFPRRCFDLVVAAEVLEHLDDPRRGLDEIARVSRDYVLVSVPREPLWRVLNMARGAYWNQWGNTPGHLQHWSARAFRQTVARRLEIVRVAHPLPWTVILARVHEIDQIGHSPI